MAAGQLFVAAMSATLSTYTAVSVMGGESLLLCA